MSEHNSGDKDCTSRNYNVENYEREECHFSIIPTRKNKGLKLIFVGNKLKNSTATYSSNFEKVVTSGISNSGNVGILGK